MVAHRLAEPVIVRLLGNWLRVGVMQDGVVTRTEEGTPQGGPSSPVLAHVSLHVGRDRWFEKQFRPLCQGEAYLTRCADDWVASFQYTRDADAVHRTRRRRVERCNLALAEEKTRLLLLGRVARERTAEYAAKPEPFDCLGCKHVCGSKRRGKVAWVRIPSPKSGRQVLARTQDWLKSHRHWKRREPPRHLTMMLCGFSQSFALHPCKPKLEWVRGEVQRQWMRVLRRRSQRHRLFWSDLKSRAWCERPYAETRHPTV